MNTYKQDELYHYGRKGMKWYQHIFSDARDRIRANRTARTMYKIARVKEKMRLAEEKAKLRQFKAKEKQSILDAKKKEASDKQAFKERKESAALNKAKEQQALKERKESAALNKAKEQQALKKANDRPEAPTVDKRTNYDMSALEVSKNAKFMTNKELVDHLTRLTTEKKIQELAATEYASKHKVKTFLKKQLSNTLDKAATAVIDYGREQAIKMVLDSLPKYTPTGGAQ